MEKRLYYKKIRKSLVDTNVTVEEFVDLKVVPPDTEDIKEKIVILSLEELKKLTGREFAFLPMSFSIYHFA
jgi:hypothetical protein